MAIALKHVLLKIPGFTDGSMVCYGRWKMK